MRTRRRGRLGLFTRRRRLVRRPWQLSNAALAPVVARVQDGADARTATMLQRLIPKVFYDHLDEGFDFFVDGLGFQVMHQENGLVVVERDGAKVYLVENPEFA